MSVFPGEHNRKKIIKMFNAGDTMKTTFFLHEEMLQLMRRYLPPAKLNLWMFLLINLKHLRQACITSLGADFWMYTD